jgi:hypothetical protein
LYIRDLFLFDWKVEHNLQEELAQSIVGVDAGPLKF